ncbi:MAG: flagellar brake protein [Phycisphaerae bacterium]|jgi:c-di-GMP-binding flagellar brake protein YcgR|nr:flagellar brake protein [Phycisphaerae bacterium]
MMNTMFPMEGTRQASVLADAIDDFRPALATWRQGEGWAAYETRFVSMDYRAGELALQYDPSEQGTPEILDGQEVCVSFRRGRGRCAFDTVVLGRGRAPIGDAEIVSTIRLEYPEELCDLQRRTHYRQQVPAADPVRVKLSIASGNTSTVTDAHGSLLDVSPVGMGVGLTEGTTVLVDAGAVADCTLYTQHSSSPIHVRARVCSRTNMSDGRVRLGLQFVDNGEAVGAQADLNRLLARVRT